MQAVSSFGQNLADDLKGSNMLNAQQNIPGTSSLSTGQAPSSSFGGQQFQEKSLGYQQGLQNQQYQNQGLQNQQYQNQGLQNQQYSQNLQNQGQNLQNQGQNLQQGQNWQGQNLQGQNLQGQNLQQGQMLPQQNLQQGWGSQQFISQEKFQWHPQQQGLQQGFIQQSTLQQQLLPATQFQVAPVILEHRESAPVIQERIRREEVEEITPVIHREREKTEIHKITQPVHTSSILGICTEEATLPAQFSEMRTPSMLPPASILPRREELSAQKMRVDKAPVVIETEKKKIIEEVTPVVYKEVVEPHLTRLTQPIYEKIVEGDVYISEVRAAQVIAPTIATTTTSIPLQTTQFVQQTQNVPVQIPFVQQFPVYSKNIEVADTFVKEGVPLTSANRGLFGRRAV
jgi:hypothetical protein